jgi:predicted phosphatase
MNHIPYEIGETNMFVVYFFENKNLLLSQLLKRVPVVGEDLSIKGRKGKVSSVTSIDDRKIHVQIVFEIIKKGKSILDPAKKKKK